MKHLIFVILAAMLWVPPSAAADSAQSWVDASAFRNFSTAKASLGTRPGALLITRTFPVNNLTVPANITVKFLPGGALTVAAGKTVTLEGGVDAALFQVFDGTGKVILAGGQVREVRPEWWGARGDGGDDTLALQSALDALNPAPGSAFHPAYGGRVILSPRTYGVSSLTMKSNVDIIGAGLFTTRLKPLGKGGYVLDVKGTDTGHRLTYVTLADFSIVTDPSRDFFLENPSRAPSGGINLAYCTGIRLDRVGIWNIAGTGINQVENYDGTLNDCHLVFVGDAAHPAMTMLSGTHDVTNAVHVNGCRFEACAYGTGLLILGSSPWRLIREIQFTNCKFENCPIDIGAAFAIGFVNCQFTHNFTARAGFRLVGHRSEITYGIKLVGCGFHTSAGKGWAVDAGGSRVYELVIDACNFSDQSRAITGSGILLANSHFLNCATPVVDLTAAGGLVNGATITGNSFVLNQGNDYCVKAPRNIIFTGNAIQTPAVSGTRGILVQQQSTINDNRFNGLELGVFMIGTDNVARNNHFFGTVTEHDGTPGYAERNFIEAGAGSAVSPLGLPSKYQVYFDAASNRLKVFTGSAWKSVPLE